VNRKKIILALRRLLLTSAIAWTGDAVAGDILPKPEIVSVGSALSSSDVDVILLAARRYYAFWNTGEERYAKEALAPDFVDLNLPEGRPQGPSGPLVASRGFRQAVPDLTLIVHHVWIAADQIISQLHFSGHFTGTFQGHAGDGRPIAFNAVDIYAIKSGRIASNWHLEDNLTLLKQLGVIAP
jgi:predicted ester cyclase